MLVWIVFLAVWFSLPWVVMMLSLSASWPCDLFWFFWLVCFVDDISEPRFDMLGSLLC